jgi:hypothetical protein
MTEAGFTETLRSARNSSSDLNYANDIETTAKIRSASFSVHIRPEPSLRRTSLSFSEFSDSKTLKSAAESIITGGLK